MRTRRACFPLLTACLTGVLAAPAAQAGWPNDPTVNVPVCVMGGTQGYEVVVSDGAGGAIVAWSDLRGAAYDLYAQRLSGSGAPLWTTNGLAFCQATNGQYQPGAIPDGTGGAIFVWEDLRGASTDIYMQRIDANGAALWAADGVALCTATGAQFAPRIEPDGYGGALVTWIDPRGSTWDVYAQRVSASGATQWTADGVAVCAAAGQQDNARLVADGTGGAIIAWDDDRGATHDIYAQRVSSAGVAQWTSNGVLVCAATGQQYAPRPVPDGAGGVVMVWQDLRGAAYDIYAQRVNSSGSAQWAADGVVVCTAALSQTTPLAVTDRAGGAIVVWNDGRSGNSDIYTQHVLSTGAMAWLADGAPIATGIVSESPTQLIPLDGVEGAIVAWYDARTGNSDLYVQRIQSGAGAWASGGVALTTHTAHQATVSIAPDGSGGVIGAWDDVRGATAQDVRAQRVDGFGQRGAQPSITRVRDVPNDQGGQMKLEWSASPLDGYPDYAIDSYWILRSVPPNLPGAAQGARLIRDARDSPLAGGRDLLVTSVAGVMTAWEYVSSQPAFHVASYSSVVPTTSDSIAGSNPRTLFMVMARKAGGSAWWFSDPDSGYSVDDLAPLTPAPFAAVYAAGAAALHWGANHEADLAGYRIYRGTTPDFLPGLANLVAAVSDTGYVDGAGAPFYYRITAVDTHGNESASAFALPSGTAGVTEVRPALLELAGAWPNPARGGAEVRWSLSRAGAVRLAVVDVAGRRVRTLERGEHAAGPQLTTWDGRDDAGRAVAVGLYFLVLEAEGRVLRERVVTLR